MSNATLEMMQEIEQAAQGVIASYEDQVEQIQKESRDRLATVAQHYDDETKRLVAEAETTAKERLVRLTKDLEETVARNDAKIQQAMTDKRAGLVEAIVEKVVASYGR